MSALFAASLGTPSQGSDADLQKREASSAWVIALSVTIGATALVHAAAPPAMSMLNQLAAGAAYGIVWLLLAWEAGLRQQGALQEGIGLSVSIRWPLVLVGGVALTATLSAIVGMVQYLTPAFTMEDSIWPISASLGDRVGANLHQPNHLATLLVWGLACWVALLASGLMRCLWALLGLVLLCAALVATGSRTGLLGLGLLLIWGVVDKRLPRSARVLLLALPLLFMALREVLPLLADRPVASLRVDLPEMGSTSGRWAVWKNCWELVKDQPWTGVGLGNFHLAWSLTPMSPRAQELFDDPHNLPIRLVVELGIPLGTLAVLGLGALLLAATQRAWRDEGPTGSLRRASALMVWMMALHCQLEYPWAYANLAVPAVMALAVAWGFDFSADRLARMGRVGQLEPVGQVDQLGQVGQVGQVERFGRWGVLMGALVGMGAILLCSTLWWEYQRVAVFSGRRIPIATRSPLPTPD